MPIKTTGSLVDILQLSTVSPKKPPRRQRRQRTITHRWTDGELNLISYLRLHRNWSWVQIQRTYFPSKTAASVRLAYSHIPSEERMRRASAASSLAVDPASTRRTSYSIPAAPSSVQTKNDIGAVVLNTLSSQDENTISANNSATIRYNLRPNRPKSFKTESLPCLVDRSRFPRFSQAFETHWKQPAAPDEDYSPPSRSPTIESNERSPSAALSPLSDASSLELFGLEVRPVNSTDSGSLIPNSPSDEFLSAEEYPVSP
ncbi:hypothetical protein V2G26_012023 [Clonostachys chloroleuca]